MRRFPIRLRFSLKAFFTFISILAVFFAWRSQVARTQRAAVAAIQAAGGTVLYDYHENGPRTWSTRGTPRGPEWLRKAIGSEHFDRVTYVGMFNTPSDDRWIEAVNDLGTVKTLLLSGDNVTDATLEELDASSELQELHLTNSDVTDDGLRQLIKFPNLRWLVANQTSITDRGMVALANLSELRELKIRDTNISDDSVASISALANLQDLDVRGTAISNKGIAKLKAALTYTQIRH